VEGGVEDDAVLLARRLLDVPALLHEEDAEALEAGVAERLAVLRDVRPEAAGAAGAGRDVDVLLDDARLGEALGLHAAEVLHEVPDRVVGRVALAAISE